MAYANDYSFSVHVFGGSGQGRGDLRLDGRRVTEEHHFHETVGTERVSHISKEQ
ncbi:MAG: hypothetical protein J5803_06055 [Desulfovibrio sp.]|nr:hypothetical protein [Desulfovibrio sp.]